ncbi:MAG: Ig-like domain-containing protein [Planctomycetota bacterium]|jgi:hypothetical protein
MNVSRKLLVAGIACLGLALVVGCGGGDPPPPDTTPPTVSNVTSTVLNGTYGIDATIDVRVTFSEAVTVDTAGGTPSITLKTGATDAVVDYASGSGTTTLVFTYTVAATHASADLDYVADSLALNLGTIKDAAGNDADLTTLAAPTAAGSLGFNKAIVIDTTGPKVSYVSASTPNGAYMAGETVDVTVTFTGPVTVTGTPQITLDTGGGGTVVDYVSGSTTATLTFTYTVAAGDTAADLDYVAASLVFNGSTIQDSATQNAVLTLPAPAGAGSLAANRNIEIDTTAPTVTGITLLDATPTNAATGVDFEVTFSEDVFGVGTANFSLLGGASGTVASVTPDAALPADVYTVTVDNVTGDGALELELDRLLTAIIDIAGNQMAVAYTAGPAYTVDTTRPTVTVNAQATTSMTPTITGTISDGGTGLDATSIQVTVDGVTYTFGDVSVAGNDWTLAGAALSSPLGDGTYDVIATVLDNVGNLGADATADELVVDTVEPWVSDVTSTKPNGTYGIGTSIDVTVTFDEVVYVTGTPQITLETGAADAVLNWSSGDGTDTQTFAYVVAAGHTSSDLDYIVTNPLVLNGGTILDAAGNAADLTTIAAPGAAGSLGANKAIVIETVRPTVQWTQPDSSTLVVDLADDIIVSFSEPMDTASVEAALTLTYGAAIEPTNGYVFTWNAGGDEVAVAPDTQNPAGIYNDDVLLPDTVYTITVGAGATDAAGNPLSPGAYTDTFTTRETTPPVLWSAEVTDNSATVYDAMTELVAVDAVEGGDAIDFNFIEADSGIDASTGSVRIVGPGVEVRADIGGASTGGTVSWTAADILTLTLDAAVSLEAGKEYSVRVTDVWDLDLNRMETTEFTLQVAQSGASVDVTAPTVISTVPLNAETGVDRMWPIMISFSEPVDVNTFGDIAVASNPAGVTIADFEMEYGPGDMGLSVVFLQPLQPLLALPDPTDITVTVPGASGGSSPVADLAGNPMADDYVFTYTINPVVDLEGPTIWLDSPTDSISRTIPAHGETNAGVTEIQIGFVDSFTLEPERIDESSLDAADFLVYDETDGWALRGWEIELDSSGTVVTLRSTAFTGLEEGHTYTVDVGPGITDLAGNVMVSDPSAEAFTFTMADYSGLSENRTPVLEDLDIEMAGSTSPLVRALSIELDIVDDDGDVVTIEIDDSAYSGFVYIVDAIDTSLETSWSYGSDGPPTADDPAILGTDSFYDSSGYYTFDITLDDGTNSSTYTKTIWIWATDADAPTDVIPSPVSVGGFAVDPDEPVLVTDTMPELVWTDVDTVEADALMVMVTDIGGMSSAGGPVPDFSAALNPNDTSATVPVDQALDVGIYLWMVNEMKFSDGFGDPIGWGWSLDFGSLVLGDMSQLFACGPTNANLYDDEHAVGQISIMLDSGTGDYQDSDDVSGMYTFGRDALDQAALSTLRSHDMVDSGGATLLPAQEFYAYDAPDLVVTDSSSMFPLPTKGFTGRTEGFFSVAQGSDTSYPLLTVGSTRAGGLTNANELDGIWSIAMLMLEDDGAGGFEQATALYGAAVLTADTATTGDAATTLVDQSGALNGPPADCPYVVDLATGEILVDLLNGQWVRGYVGGGATGKDIIVLAGDSDADTPCLIVMARQADLTATADVTGTYNFTQIEVMQDTSSGPPYTFVWAGTGWGDVTFDDGAGTWTANLRMPDGQTDTDSGTYAVDTVNDIVTLDDGSGGLIEMVCGPDASTGFGIAVTTGDSSLARLVIASKP